VKKLLSLGILVTALTLGFVTPAASAGPVQPSAVEAAVAAPAKAFKYKTFHTPSRNIICGGLRTGNKYSIRCDVLSHDWTAPGPNPCNGTGDYGSSVGMNGRKGSPKFTCVSDATPYGKTLSYGSYWSMGPISCQSKQSGLNCSNGKSRGWFLSKQTYNFF